MDCDLQGFSLHFNWATVTPTLAIIISFVALITNRRIAQRNIRLSIQQLIFKTVVDKAKECNAMWEEEPESEKRNPNSAHFRIVSELVITKEIIDKSFSLFGKNYKSIKTEYEDDFYYLLWKQLRTDLRGWIRRTPEIAVGLNNQYYSAQVKDLFEKFEKHFEPVL